MVSALTCYNLAMENLDKRPLIIAHRGASAHAPENTMPAFQIAYEQGADGIELDVMLSKDNRLIVIHDSTLDRTTNGKGNVLDHTISELHGLDAGAWLNETFQNTKLPLLDEVYEQFGGKFLINVELKNYHNPKDELPDVALALTQKHDLLDYVIFSSFNPRNIVRLKKLDSCAKTGLLCLPGFAGSLFRGPFGRLFGYNALHPHFSDVTESTVKRAHKNKNQVNVWTVNKIEDLIRMRSIGVDAIITDDPQHAKSVLEQ